MEVSEYTYLGQGVFGLGEAARYLRTSPNRIRAWFRTAGSSARNVFTSDLPSVDGSHAISFHDLVDSLVAVRLRERGVSLATVRESYNVMQARYGFAHPFCAEVLRTDGREIFLELAENIESRKLEEVVSGQGFFERVIKDYLIQIDYDQGIAQRWAISRGIVIDPNVRFGSPVLQGRRIEAESVIDAYVANDRDPDLVARMFELDTHEVLNALKFGAQFLRSAA